MKPFSETWNEIVGGVSTNAKGNKIYSHSKADFDAICKGLLNDPDYTVDTVKTEKGEQTTVQVKPTEEFRKGFVKSLLKKCGHDSAEAEKLAMETEIDNVSGIYEFTSEALYGYMTAGKKFNFLGKEDFVGSIKIEDVPEKDVPYRDLKTGEPAVSHQGAYKKLIADSNCPAGKRNK